MKTTIPYEKEIVFNTKIAEITSISLEKEASILNHEITGDFILSGDYKMHEVSVNKEPFTYRLPFSVELPDNIIEDSIFYDVHNFTYEVIEEDTLKVYIELLVTGEEVEEIEEPIIEKEETQDRVEETLDSLLEEVEEKKEELVEEDRVENTSVGEEFFQGEDTFVTYHIHVIKENETIEEICTTYKISKEILEEYNNTSEWMVGTKILIPELENE